MAPPLTDGWTLWPWSRQDDQIREPDPIPDGLLEDLEDQLATAKRGDSVQVPAWVLQLLVDNARPAARTPGAVIVDKARGAQYRATVQTGDGEVQLTSVEVLPAEPGGTLSTRALQVPGQHLADAVASYLARQAAAEARSRTEGGSGKAVLMAASVRRKAAAPSAEELRELVREGLNRTAIAERYDRSASTVDQWLRVARRDRPDLEWPARRRGPRPGTVKPKTTTSTKPKRGGSRPRTTK